MKWAARLTQLYPSTIVEQSCERYYENHIIQRSVEIIKQLNAMKYNPKESQLLTTLQHQSQQNQKCFDDHQKFTHYV